MSLPIYGLTSKILLLYNAHNPYMVYYGGEIMNTCTFFGHRQCSGEIKPHLQQTIIDLIKNHNVDTFYVGNQGNFDKIVISVLTELAKQYDYIHYHIVLAYLPS